MYIYLYHEDFYVKALWIILDEGYQQLRLTETSSFKFHIQVAHDLSIKPSSSSMIFY